MNIHFRKILFIGMCLMQLGVCAFLIYRWETVLIHGAPFKLRTRAFDPYDAFRGRYVALDLEQNYVASDDLDAATKLPSGAKYYVEMSTDPDGFSKFAKFSTERPVGSQSFLALTISRTETNYVPLLPEDILDPLQLASRIKSAEDQVSQFIRDNGMEYEMKQIDKSISTSKAGPPLAALLSNLLNRILDDRNLYVMLYGTDPNTIQKKMRERGVKNKILDLTFRGLCKLIPVARIYFKHPFYRFYMEETLAPRAEQAYLAHARQDSAERAFITVRILNGYGVIENLWIGEKTIVDFLNTQTKNE